MTFPWYALMVAVGLLGSALFWAKRFQREPLMIAVYIIGLLGALIGAKLGYVLTELHVIWQEPGFWMHLATGNTILGALLGGYAGVETGKRLIRRTAPTGDAFAVIVPLGLALGRVGCVLHGCCQGVVCEPAWWTIADAQGQHRWPAQPVEALFNIVMACVVLTLLVAGRQRGQLFHIYLIAYGLFRFGHEWLRQTPRIGPGLSAYQGLALAVFVLGFWRFVQRRRANSYHRPLGCAERT